MAKKKKLKFPYLARCVNMADGFPFKNGDIVVMLGELSNMQGHYVFSHEGKIYDGWHLDHFVPYDGWFKLGDVELPEE